MFNYSKNIQASCTVLLLIILSSCSGSLSRNDLEKATVDIASGFSIGTLHTSATAIDKPWWLECNDPTLNTLIKSHFQVRKISLRSLRINNLQLLGILGLDFTQVLWSLKKLQ